MIPQPELKSSQVRQKNMELFVYIEVTAQSSAPPAKHSSYPPTHTANVPSLQLSSSCEQFSCKIKHIFAILRAQTPNHTSQRPSALFLSLWFRFPDTSSKDQAESHMSDGDSLANRPCEVQVVKVNNDRSGKLSKWNQRFPKLIGFRARVCGLKPVEKCCSTKQRRASKMPLLEVTKVFFALPPTLF